MGAIACLNFANQAVDQQTEDWGYISLPGIHHTEFLCITETKSLKQGSQAR